LSKSNVNDDAMMAQGIKSRARNSHTQTTTAASGSMFNVQRSTLGSTDLLYITAYEKSMANFCRGILVISEGMFAHF
jgi:hypothetical protein